MNEPFSEELLSAYVDGELSASERAEVERWLEQHPAARDRVEDFRRLSQMFGNLSRTEMPLEFRTEVLQRAERRMLLPDPATPASKGRGWLLALAAPLAAAAVLVLTVQILDRGEVKQGEFAGVDPEHPAKPAARGRISNDFIVAEQFDTPFSDLESTVNTDGTPAAPVNPQLAAIDDAVHRIIESRPEDKVLSVVKVYVADRANGLVLMQKVLEDNNIPVERGEHPAPAKPDAAPLDDGSRNDALYIVAEPEELIAAFTEMLNRRHPDLRVDVEAPVALAMLDDASRIQFQAVEKEFAASNLRRDNADGQADQAPAGAAKPTGAKPGMISGKAPADVRAAQAEQGLESAILRKDSSDQKQNADKEVAQKKMMVNRKKGDASPEVPSDPGAKAQADRPNVANRSSNPELQQYSKQMKSAASNSARRAEPSEGEGNRQASGYSNSRQAVVNLSPAFENRQRNSLSKREAISDQPPGDKSRAAAPRPTAADELAPDAARTAAVEEKLQQPALVRMLIVIEPEGR